MVIKELNLKNFGKFQNKKISLSLKVNIIYGDNEAGKTTVHSFIRGMFLGIEKPRGRESKDELYSRYLPWDTQTLYAGSMRINVDNKDYQIYRGFYKEAKKLEVIDLDFGKEIATETGKIPPIFGSITKENYRNTISIEQNRTNTDRELATSLRNYLANFDRAKSNEIDVEKALRTLKNQKKKIEDKGINERKKKIEKEIEECYFQELRMEDIIRKIKQLSIQDDKSKEDIEEEPESKRKFTGIISGVFFTGLMGAFTIWKGKFSIQFIAAYSIISVLAMLLYMFLLSKAYRKRQIETESVKKREDVNSTRQQEIYRLNWELEQIEEKIRDLERLNQQYEALKLEELQDQKEIKAINLAVHTIKDISHQIHDGFGIQFAKSISDMICQETKGKYNKVYIDDELEMKVSYEDKVISIDSLSKGTMEQFYLALRLASGNLLLSEESMPIILDDCFVFYDEKRLEAVIDMLLNQERQIILFTCHWREINLLRSKGIEFNLIEL